MTQEVSRTEVRITDVIAALFHKAMLDAAGSGETDPQVIAKSAVEKLKNSSFMDRFMDGSQVETKTVYNRGRTAYALYLYDPDRFPEVPDPDPDAPEPDALVIGS